MDDAQHTPAESRHHPAPKGWLPRCGESVTWSKTGGIIFEVRQLTREGALIAGELLGMKKEYRVALRRTVPGDGPAADDRPGPRAGTADRAGFR